MSFHDTELDAQAYDLDAVIARSDVDPRHLHAALRDVVDELTSTRQPVPRHLYQALARLEADIAETHFNNVPV